MLTQRLTVVMLSVISCCMSVCDLCDSADPVCKQAVVGGRVIGDARPRQSRRKTKETKSQTAAGRPTRSRRVHLGSTGATVMMQLIHQIVWLAGSKLETGSEDTQLVKLENISSTVPQYSTLCVLNVLSVTLCSKPEVFLPFYVQELAG